MFDAQQFAEIGFRSADLGFYFDATELVAELVNELRDASGLAPALPVLRYASEEAEGHLSALRHHYRLGVSGPIGEPTGYRSFLTNEVFRLVEQLATLTQYARAQHLQAAFYAGFGLGRLRSVARAILLVQRLASSEAIRDSKTLSSVPRQLRTLAEEAARQLLITRRNDDARALHPRIDAVLREIPEIPDELRALLEVDPTSLREAVGVIDAIIPEMTAMSR